VDYSIWGTLQPPVFRQKINDNDHLKQVINSCSDMISQELINGVIDQ